MDSRFIDLKISVEYLPPFLDIENIEKTSQIGRCSLWLLPFAGVQIHVCICASREMFPIPRLGSTRFSPGGARGVGTRLA